MSLIRNTTTDRPQGLPALGLDGSTLRIIQVNATGQVATTGGSGVTHTDDAVFTPGTDDFTPSGGTYRSVLDLIDDNDAGVFAMTQRRSLHSSLRRESDGAELGTSSIPFRVDPTGTTAQPVTDNAGSLTVDGTVSISGTVPVDSELPAAAAFADNTTNPTAPAVGAFGHVWDGATWDRTPGTSADGVTVNLGANNDVTIPGTVTVDSELPAAVALADNAANPTAPAVGSFGMVWDGATWDRATGTSADGTTVNLGANNDVTITGTVTVDSELPAAVALADNASNPTAPAVGAFGMVWDGATWDRAAGTSADGATVNLGANNDVTVTGTVTVDSELPAAVALADNASNPTAPAVGAFGMVWDGATWDRAAGTSADGALVNLGANNDVTVTGTVTVAGVAAHDVAVSGNPVRVGGRGRTSDVAAVANDDTTDLITDAVGKQVVLPYALPETFIRGVTAAITTTANTSVIAAQGAGVRIYVTQILVTNESSGIGTVVEIKDGTTVMYRGFAAKAGGGFSLTFPVPLRLTANTALQAANITTGSSTYVSASGYTGA